MEPLNALSESIHFVAREHGFWKDEHENSFNAQRIALMHSELSEALEALRDDDYIQVKEELADCIIRILDFSYAQAFDMDKAVKEKMKINEGRPFMHGKKM